MAVLQNLLQTGADFDVFVGEAGEDGAALGPTVAATIMPLDSTPRSLRARG